MSDRVQKILLVFIQSNWMYVKHVEHIKAYNFLNDGPICNLLALLELSYSLLFTEHISYILMLNMSDRVQKILLVFIDSNLILLNMSDRHVSLYSKVHKTSINNMMPNSKFLNTEILWFNPLIYKVLRIKLPKNSIYNYFQLNCTEKVWIKWNFKLTVFELTVQFNTEKIGKFQRFWKKFELSGTSN